MKSQSRISRFLKRLNGLSRALLLCLSSAAAFSGPPLQAAQQYQIQAAGGKLTVGEPIQYDGLIVILRPSPGDNFWYRLPHRIELTGDLPPGIRLVQKGPGFHELAHFSGTPTGSGTFTVQLSGTMADGLQTAKTSVTFLVESPKSRDYRVQHWGTDQLLAASEVVNAGFQLVGPDYRLLRAPLEVKATGLPEGLSLTRRGDEGYYPLTGTPKSPGAYKASVQFFWPDSGALVASADLTIAVLSAGEASTSLQLSVVAPGPLRQGVFYAGQSFKAPWFYVEDQFGRRIKGPFEVSSSGLPQGMAFSEEGFLVGRPASAGSFAGELEVTAPDGNKTSVAKFTVEVKPELSLANYAGIYDCLMDRGNEVNGNMGGRLRFTLSRGGQISGFLMVESKRYAFTSSAVDFDEEGRTRTISPPRSGLVISGSFLEEQDYSIGAGNPFLKFAGTVWKEDASVAVHGSRATPRSSAAPSPFGGLAPVNIMFVQTDEALLEKSFGGAGFMAVGISPSGNATITLWAADGSAPVSMATTLSESSIGAFMPVYTLPSNSSGNSTLLGDLFLNSDGDAAGQLSWHQRPSQSGAFPEGVALINYGGIIGSRHVQQPQGLNRLGLEQSITEAQLDLIGDEVPDASEVILALGNGRMTAVAAQQQVSNVRLNYNARTGIVTGTMVLDQTRAKRGRTVTFRGMRSADGETILGHYTVPKAANSSRSSAGMLKISSGED